MNPALSFKGAVYTHVPEQSEERLYSIPLQVPVETPQKSTSDTGKGEPVHRSHPPTEERTQCRIVSIKDANLHDSLNNRLLQVVFNRVCSILVPL